MDILNIFHAFILGIVEGATEFLPVSSTGHLIIVGDWLGFNDDKAKVFEIVIQLGAILAVVWEYRERVTNTITGMLSNSTAQRFIANLMIAFLPSALLGFFFIKTIKALFFNPLSVAIALIVGAFVIFWVERMHLRPRVKEVDDMTARDALMVGLAQAVSLIPGTSRAGATIIGGMVAGLSRKTATEFSFFLAIPTMFAATFYDVFKHRDLLQMSDLPMFGVGFVTSFVAALIAVRALIRFVSSHTFNGFAWYRLIFGTLVLLYYWNKV